MGLGSTRKTVLVTGAVDDGRERLRAYAEVVFNLACPAAPRHFRTDAHATLTTSVRGEEAS